MRLQLPDSVVHELTARTEGWLVGLQLLALSLQGHTQPQELLQALHGSHHTSSTI
jgi:LuxR family maltose regulon positive regulatory protein